MTAFEVLPAIDLRGGLVVRLRQGDFDRELAYGSDPRGVAASFAADGARWLHVIDLDGALAGEPRQLDIAAGLVAEVRGRTHVELGGGLRTAAAVAGALSTGAARVAIGTAALHDPAFAASVVTRHGAQRIVGSIDVRDGMALGEGWRPGSAGLPADEAVAMLADAGITTFEVTAIERDGELEGPDLVLLRRLVDLGRGSIIASGGIASIDDVLAVRDLGCTGAIIGRAIYEQRISLRDVLEAVGSGRIDRG